MGEEIFRFDVLLTPDKEIEIGVTVKEIEVEGYPEFGEEYGHLAHLYAELVVEHVGMNTEMFMNSVSGCRLSPQILRWRKSPRLKRKEMEKRCFCIPSLLSSWKRNFRSWSWGMPANSCSRR